MHQLMNSQGHPLPVCLQLHFIYPIGLLRQNILFTKKIALMTYKHKQAHKL